MPKPGKRAAQKRNRQAADLGVAVKEWTYEPPPNCDEYVYPVPLDENVQYVYAMQVYRRQAVHFSVEIQVRDHALAAWQVAYRIDTSHGVVHEHEFTRDADTDEATQTDWNELARIPKDNPWTFVDCWLQRAMDMCQTSWTKHLERWQS